MSGEEDDVFDQYMQRHCASVSHGTRAHGDGLAAGAEDGQSSPQSSCFRAPIDEKGRAAVGCGWSTHVRDRAQLVGQREMEAEPAATSGARRSQTAERKPTRIEWLEIRTGVDEARKAVAYLVGDSLVLDKMARPTNSGASGSPFSQRLAAIKAKRTPRFQRIAKDEHIDLEGLQRGASSWRLPADGARSSLCYFLCAISLIVGLLSQFMPRVARSSYPPHPSSALAAERSKPLLPPVSPQSLPSQLVQPPHSVPPPSLLPRLTLEPAPSNSPSPQASSTTLELESRLNYQWTHGWVVVHVIDHGGIPVSFEDLERFKELCEDGAAVWAQVGKPKLSPYRPGLIKDALSASGINSAHPAVFQPGSFIQTYAHKGSMKWEIGEQMKPYYHMPILLLNATSIQDRVNCCAPWDAATNNRRCETLGGNDTCIPGCAKLRLRKDLVHECFPETHGLYNEIVLDVWRDGGWGDGAEKAKYITGFALDVNASNITRRLALEVQGAAGADGLRLPLYWFNSSHPSEAFKLWRVLK
mmetsp:Transcript_15577/g.43641  ORF Transcript_15577/g.43641 Transcript_15577/m.43641 type:complete len:528 (-) Transcript_15577:295-1878(-)